MKIDIQKSKFRGYFDHGWLQTYHSFSFASYYNPARMGFGALRVINEDVVQPGEGFPEHEHDNMEIVTIVLEGALEHKDSTGGSGVIAAGDVQRMSAGKGVTHSEFNASKTQPVHLLQIWIETANRGIQPSYEQESFKNNSLIKVVSPSGPLHINQNAKIHVGRTEREISHKIEDKSGLFVFVIDGQIDVEGYSLGKGDAAAITKASEVVIKPAKKSHLLLIEVPVK